LWASAGGYLLTGLPGPQGRDLGPAALYKKRNEFEQLFRRLKALRRTFSRFEKLDALFLGFLNFALIIEALRLV